MVKTQNTIEINGKHYDAATGALISSVTRQSEAINQGAAMDGFVRRKPGPEHDVRHHKRTVQKASTLMRQAVKKPALAADAGISNKAVTSNVSIHDQRLKRAHEAPKSPLISRFSFGDIASTVRKSIPHTVVEKPATIKRQPAVASAHAHAVATLKSSRAGSHSLVEKALIKAQSHTQAPHHVKKQSRLARRFGISRKKSTLASGVLAALLLGTFFAYQNVPNFAMRVAAARAGFDASMPGYQPSGFSFKSPIKYSPGEVIVNFDSNTSDGRAFTLTERKTDWSSDDLRANFVQKQDSQHQTIIDANQVVYTYGDGDAAWVNDGVWYQLESTASLTSDQIVRIAQSL